jgi:hypothetical protein
MTQGPASPARLPRFTRLGRPAGSPTNPDQSETLTAVPHLHLPDLNACEIARHRSDEQERLMRMKRSPLLNRRNKE